MSASHAANFKAISLPLQVHGDDQKFLRSKFRRESSPLLATKTFVDLFSGCGGISLGVREAIADCGFYPKAVLALDNFAPAASVYTSNFPEVRFVTSGIESLFAEHGDQKLTGDEKALRKEVGAVDFLVGGPPCQGHSDLNNYSRRNDPKNSLYLYMGRAAAVFRPKHILIENVVGAAHDINGVVGSTVKMLTELGYSVEYGIINALSIGIPQSRRRLIVIGSREKKAPRISLIEKENAIVNRKLDWCIRDLENVDRNSVYDAPSKPSKDNLRRIDYLFNKNLLDLPNSQRPACHKSKKHSYNSVYGRLSWDKPAQTITSGFYSMCMGRYVHPGQRRTLTAHEAARIQFFPDYFDFSSVAQRTHLATIIGNAVPMKMAYLVTRKLLQLEQGNK